MKLLAYILIKSLIQGLYKGTLFFTAIFTLIFMSAFLTSNYFMITSLSDVFKFNTDAMGYFSKIDSRMWVGYFITIGISAILMAIKNTIERKK